jgi:hypothetical protein
MKTITKNKINMYESVLVILKQHESDWSGVPIYVETVAEFEAALNELKNKAVVQNNITLGVAQNKKEQYKKLCESMEVIENALWVYATATNHYELAARHKISSSVVQKMGSVVRLIHLEKVMQDCEEHASELIAYGITASFIEEFVVKAEIYAITSNQPRLVTVTRKMLTSDLIERTLVLDRILRFKLDKLIVIFKTSAPEFGILYQNARLVMNYKGHHNTKTEKPPTEPDDGGIV